MNPSFHDWAGDKRLKGLVLLVLTLAVVALAGYTYFSFKSARYMYNGPTTISVKGIGEVTKTPDIATFTFSVEAEGEKPATAQQKSAAAVNKITAYLKEKGIAETDIKTVNYSLYPQYGNMPTATRINPFTPQAMEIEIMPPDYNYNNNIIGYAASQTFEIKARDTEKAGELIAGVGERGATNVTGLTFTLDDDESAKAEAREKAIADAKEKAKHLADALGVRLTRLQGFWEEEGYYPMERGYGGGMMDDATLIAPDMPVGENTITSVVNLSYEIR